MLLNPVSSLELGVLFAIVTYYILWRVIAKAKMGIFCQNSVWNHLRFKRENVHVHCLDTLRVVLWLPWASNPPSAGNSAVMWSVNGQMCRDYENGSYFIITFLFKHNNNMFCNWALGGVDNILSCTQSCDTDALFPPANFTCQTVVLVPELLLRNKLGLMMHVTLLTGKSKHIFAHNCVDICNTV